MKSGTKYALFDWTAGLIAASVWFAVDWSRMTTPISWIALFWVCILTPAFCLIAGIMLFGKDIR